MHPSSTCICKDVCNFNYVKKKKYTSRLVPGCIPLLDSAKEKYGGDGASKIPEFSGCLAAKLFLTTLEKRFE